MLRPDRGALHHVPGHRPLRQGQPGSLPHLLHAVCAQPGASADDGNRHHPDAPDLRGRAGGPAEKELPPGASAPDTRGIPLWGVDGLLHVADGPSGTGRLPVVRRTLPAELPGHRLRRLSPGQGGCRSAGRGRNEPGLRQTLQMGIRGRENQCGLHAGLHWPGVLPDAPSGTNGHPGGNHCGGRPGGNDRPILQQARLLAGQAAGTADTLRSGGRTPSAGTDSCLRAGRSAGHFH